MSITDLDPELPEYLTSDEMWPMIVDRVIEFDPKPSDLRVILLLSTLIRVDGSELPNGERMVADLANLSVQTVALSVRWLVALGVIERLPGTPERPHCLRFVILDRSTPHAPPHWPGPGVRS